MPFEMLPMSRRAFGRMLGAFLLAAPRMAMAQGATMVRRIGVLEPGEPSTLEWDSRQAEPLRDLGWVEGTNLYVERRYARNRPEALQPLAEELVRARVEIIVTGGTPATLAAKRATTTIPIVIRTAGDPVLLGLVASLARPGGNVTGYSNTGPERVPKYLSLLKELLPALQRVGVLEYSANPYFRVQREQFEHSCRSLRLDPVFAEVAVAGEIEGAIVQLARQRVQALVLRADDFTYDHRFEIVAAAMKHGLPTLAEDTDMVREAATLIGYSSTQADQDRVRAEYIDRILRGAEPANLPVRQATKFELVINLKTAKALGLSIPRDLLLRADEVIQ
jgi:putative ABC transport system substrate-binding protein